MLWTKWTTRQQGNATEKLAQQYLQQQGLTPITTNFSSRYGEVDLIMSDNNCLVFVEVKYRQSAQFGGPLAAVSKQKQTKLIKTSQIYMQQQHLNEYNTHYRFDMVGLLGSLNSPEIIWLKNAF